MHGNFLFLWDVFFRQTVVGKKTGNRHLNTSVQLGGSLYFTVKNHRNTNEIVNNNHKHQGISCGVFLSMYTVARLNTSFVCEQTRTS